jgi:hypothetical protein
LAIQDLPGFENLAGLQNASKIVPIRCFRSNKVPAIAAANPSIVSGLTPCTGYPAQVLLGLSSKNTSPFEKGGSRGICLINLPRPLFFKEGSEHLLFIISNFGKLFSTRSLINTGWYVSC